MFFRLDSATCFTGLFRKGPRSWLFRSWIQTCQAFSKIKSRKHIILFVYSFIFVFCIFVYFIIWLFICSFMYLSFLTYSLIQSHYISSFWSLLTYFLTFIVIKQLRNQTSTNCQIKVHAPTRPGLNSINIIANSKALVRHHTHSLLA